MKIQFLETRKKSCFIQISILGGKNFFWLLLHSDYEIFSLKTGFHYRQVLFMQILPYELTKSNYELYTNLNNIYYIVLHTVKPLKIK